MDIFNYDIKFKAEKKIILCCTEKMREIAAFCLASRKLEVWKYCDIEEKNNGKQRYISIANTHKEVSNGNAILLIALGKNVLYYLNKLETAGFEVIYSMRYLVSMTSLRKSDLYHECQSSIENMGDMFFYEDAYMHKDKIYISSIDATVTSRCSLKCKDCSNLMQYYSKPQNYDVEEILKTLDIILQKIDMLNDLAKKNETKGLLMQPEHRLTYDLSVLINKYDSYLRWKEKQKILETEKETEKSQNIVSQSIGYTNVSKDSKADTDDISGLVDDIFG